MFHRRRWRILTIVLAASLAAGCVTDSENTGKDRGFPWIVESEVPRSRKDLRDPNSLDLTFARWQEQMGRIDEAGESYRRVLKNDSKSMDAQLGLARLEQLAGHKEAAEQAFRKIVEANPKSAAPLDALGQFYAAEQRWNEAVATLARATEAAPQDTVCRHHYAVALARAGNQQAAFAQFTQIVSEAEAHYNLGYLLYEQGRSDLAEREFLLAVTLRPELTSAQMMLDELRRARQGSPLVARGNEATHADQLASAVMQTAAVSTRGRTHQVATAAATEPITLPANTPRTMIQPAAPMTIPSTAVPAVAAPVAVPPAQMAPQPLPVTQASVPPTPTLPTPEIAIAQPGVATTDEWQMPVRHDPKSIFKEQLRNQVPESGSR